MPTPLSWVELDAAALAGNLTAFRALLAPGVALAPVVKSEAYGHGLLPVARACVRGGASWLAVFNLGEALALRREGLTLPVLVLGYVPLADVAEAVAADVSFTVSSLETLDAARAAAGSVGRPARVHLKLETGTHRLGFDEAGLEAALGRIGSGVVLEGAHTHFANIEDTTEHEYATAQLERLRAHIERIRAAGHALPMPHSACTAATILFPETHLALVRVGVGFYGLWPSKETWLSARGAGRGSLDLRPVMTWKTRVAQVKDVPAGGFVGYGCTYRTTRPTRLAVLPVGYANGYDRLFSNRAHVLVRGGRAPVRGRVCMNLCMVNVTDIPGVALEDEVILLGGSGEEERLTAEQLAAWAGTINYEIVTRADPFAPRIVVG